MAYKTLSMEEVVAFRRHLEAQERSAGTVENYLRHVSAFARWLAADRPAGREGTAGAAAGDHLRHRHPGL